MPFTLDCMCVCALVCVPYLEMYLFIQKENVHRYMNIHSSQSGTEFSTLYIFPSFFFTFRHSITCTNT